MLAQLRSNSVRSLYDTFVFKKDTSIQCITVYVICDMSKFIKLNSGAEGSFWAIRKVEFCKTLDGKLFPPHEVASPALDNQKNGPFP